MGKRDNIVALLLIAAFLAAGAPAVFAGGGNIITVVEPGIGQEFGNEKGQINQISLEKKEIMISDSLYALADGVKYYNRNNSPVGSSGFTAGSWVIYRLNSQRQVTELTLTEPGEQQQVKQEIKSSNQTGPGSGIYFENGVYKN